MQKQQMIVFFFALFFALNWTFYL